MFQFIDIEKFPCRLAKYMIENDHIKSMMLLDEGT
jgi:hypothetical protein